MREKKKRYEIHTILGTHFFVKCRPKKVIEISFRETKKRFNLFATNSVC